MNRGQELKWLGLAMVLVVVVSGLLSAQDQPTRGTMDVPFDFYISGNKLPAGQYSLDLIAPTYAFSAVRAGTARIKDERVR